MREAPIKVDSAQELRSLAVEWLKKNEFTILREGFAISSIMMYCNESNVNDWKSYCIAMDQGRLHGDIVTLVALSYCLKTKICVVQDLQNLDMVTITKIIPGKPIDKSKDFVPWVVTTKKIPNQQADAYRENDNEQIIDDYILSKTPARDMSPQNSSPEKYEKVSDIYISLIGGFHYGSIHLKSKVRVAQSMQPPTPLKGRGRGRGRRRTK